MRKWLLPDERIVVETRQHGSVLAGPSIAVLVVFTAGGVLLGWLNRGGLRISWGFLGETEWRTLVLSCILGLVLVVLLWGPARRYLRWWATRYLLTSLRVVVRTGWIARHYRDVSLHALRSVDIRQNAWQRLMRSGDIALMLGSDADAPAQVVFLANVPQVRVFRSLVYEAMIQRPERPEGELMNTR